MATDPLDPRLLRSENRKQLVLDILRNTKEAPEALFTIGSGLVDMAGTGLGTLAGMAKQKLAGENVNLDAATEGLQEGKFTYQPRTEGAQEFLRGLETVTSPLEKGAQWAGQKTTDVTGSPAAGAAVYTALNVVDPQLLAPAAVKIGAVRGAAKVARDAAKNAVPMNEALKGVPKGQRGAYTMEDLSGTEGDFQMRSTVEEALSKLKPQEAKGKGKQMLKVLEKYGARKGELEWTGLTDLLSQDMPVTADDIRAHLTDFGVKVEPSRYGKSGPPQPPLALNEDAVRMAAAHQAEYSGELDYPYRIFRGEEDIGTANSYREAVAELARLQNEFIEEQKKIYLENASDYLSPAELATHDDFGTLEAWAKEKANNDVYRHNWDYAVNYELPATNYDEVLARYMDRVRADPETYGLGRSTPRAKWKQYDIESPGGVSGDDYGETVLRLTREGKYGRGVTVDPNISPEEYATLSPFKKAQYDALRRTKADPMTASATRDYRFTTHFPDTNPLSFTRDATWPKPPGGATEGTTRAVIESQSDWGQTGRKYSQRNREGVERMGFFSPEKMREKTAKALADAPQQYAEYATRTRDLIGQLGEDELKDVAKRMGHNDPEEFLARFKEIEEAQLANPTMDFADYISQVAQNIYYTTFSPRIENAALALQSESNNYRAKLSGNGSEPWVPPAPFVEDTKKWTKLNLQQAIADAVQRNDQYIAVSPGYSHAPERWGSEDFSFWTDPAEPTKRKYAVRPNLKEEGTRGEEWKQTVRALRRGDTSSVGHAGLGTGEIDLNDPNALKQMIDVVARNLNYEASGYADPQQFIEDRAAKILETMRKEQEGQYSPRVHGMNDYYNNITASVLNDILKDAGSTGSGRGVIRGAEAPIGHPMAMVFDSTLNEWRPRQLNSPHEIEQYRELAQQQPDKYQFRPAEMAAYAEIDPELARAAKRGFRFPF